jgi:protein-tyrosine phosphatase
MARRLGARGSRGLPPLSQKDDLSKRSKKIRRVVVDFDLLRGVAGRNFRDLGGHPTHEGRSVRRGVIYRSSHLSRVPDKHPLKQLRLRTVVTLQSRVEVTHLGPPDDSLLRAARWEHIPMGDVWFEEGSVPLERDPAKGHLFLVTTLSTDWGRFFRLLAEPDVYPLLFHCSAGRDRTGVGAAMLLELLGVERARIVEDFLESNLVFPKMPLTAANLKPVFESIDEAGGIRPFMQNVIGVDDSHLDAIRKRLLEN